MLWLTEINGTQQLKQGPGEGGERWRHGIDIILLTGHTINVGYENWTFWISLTFGWSVFTITFGSSLQYSLNKSFTVDFTPHFGRWFASIIRVNVVAKYAIDGSENYASISICRIWFKICDSVPQKTLAWNIMVGYLWSHKMMNRQRNWEVKRKWSYCVYSDFHFTNSWASLFIWEPLLGSIFRDFAWCWVRHLIQLWVISEIKEYHVYNSEVGRGRLHFAVCSCG